jgi:kumamolisin
MDPSAARTELPGSERRPPEVGRRIGPADPNEIVDVTVVLRRDPGSRASPIRGFLEPGGSARRRFVRREDFPTAYGASAEDVGVVRSFARSSGLEVVGEDRARRVVHLSGTVARLAAAFGASLDRYDHPAGAFRARTGPLRVPVDLRDRLVAVLGLDNRPQARTHFRICPANAPGAVAYTPPQVASAYSFPSGADGAGECVGLIELGGGYRASDLSQYFASLGVAAPSVASVSVDGATNAPTGSASGPDGEVELDVEIAGSLAPGASIAVYFAPNTDQGFVDAVSTAVHDTTRRPSVVSISWGGPEASWTGQSRAAFESVFEDAAALGVTVLVAAGDDGADDGGPGTGLSVDFPASSPEVIACGGTRLVLAGGAIAEEVVWNDLASGDGATGGGVSVDFARPNYQTGFGVPAAPNGFVGRGVPDVAGDADPTTGYRVLVDGSSTVIGGTSAVAPLWAALVARINQVLGGPVGFVNARLYAASESGGFRDITSGDNGGYQAGPGWDACSGLGSPEGTALTTALRGD